MLLIGLKVVMILSLDRNSFLVIGNTPLLCCRTVDDDMFCSFYNDDSASLHTCYKTLIETPSAAHHVGCEILFSGFHIMPPVSLRVRSIWAWYIGISLCQLLVSSVCQLAASRCLRESAERKSMVLCLKKTQWWGSVRLGHHKVATLKQSSASHCLHC